jgi:branched-chain amino acid aminotransferase
LYLFFNNKFYDTATPIILGESKAFRYGELIFETIRYSNNKIHFLAQHFLRLHNVARLMHINFPKLFNEKILELHILNLIKKNNLDAARIRVTIFKGEGGLFENDETAFNILLETYPLPNSEYILNSNGLDVCFYKEIKKTTDKYSNYKTGNHLIYNQSALYAKAQKCNESFITNVNNLICDSTIANIFIIKDANIYTPPLQHGCVDGIMRQYLLNNVTEIQEKSITENDILNADEIFVTNTIKGIQWVKQIEHKSYECKRIATLFEQIIKPLNKQ